MATKTKLILTAVDKTKRAIDSAGRNLRGLEKTAQMATRAFGVLIGAGAIGGLIKGVVDAGVSMERIERGLRAATGSAESGARAFAFVRDESLRLGLSLESSADQFAKMTAAAKGTKLEGENIRAIFSAVNEASRVMGLSVEQTTGSMRAIEQMISKGNVQAEELRGQLGERLPGAFQIAARAMGVTTEKLNDMLDTGDVLAEVMLPLLAKELRRTFGGEVESAANDAQAAFARMSTAIFELKAAIAESGVLDAIAAMADELRKLVGGRTVEEKIVQIRIAIEDMKRTWQSAGGIGPIPKEYLSELRSELIGLLSELPQLSAAQEILNEVFVSGKRRADDFDKSLEKIVSRFATAEMRAADLRAELARFRDALSPELIAAMEAEIVDIMTGGLEEIVITTKRRFTKPMEDEFEEISQASIQAARDIQRAFADFLFDPFEDGVRGMVRGFADAIRRMLANKAAVQLIGFLGGLFDGGIVGAGSKSGGASKAVPGFAHGGSFVVGGSGGTDSQFVPFMATPGERVTVSKPGQSSSIIVNQNYNIEAGADWITLQKVLPPLFEKNRLATIAEIQQNRLDGRF